MRAKDQLRRIRHIIQEIEATQEHVRQLEDLATRITVQYGKERVQTSDGTTMADAIAKLVDLKRLLSRQVQAMCEAKTQALDLIDLVQDDRLRTVLRHRYMCGMTWEQIAVDLDITFQWVHVLHSRALAEIDEKSLA